MKLLLATSNPGKASEIAASLTDLGIEIVTLANLDLDAPEPEETGDTFAENGRIKAEYWANLANLPTLADDSGLLVDALPGELGAKTRRFGAGPAASDAAWLEYFLGRMAAESNRAARFVCVLALAVPGQEIEYFEGEVAGEITAAAEAPIKPGIPVSSVFRPAGSEKVFSAMTESEKSEWSHRGRALTLLRAKLAKMLA